MTQENLAADEAQFESGYSDVPTETPERTEEPETKPEPKAEEQKADANDPLKEVFARLDKYEASQNKLAGHIGGLTRTQDEIKQLLAASKKATETVADAPTDAQVKEAMKSPQEWESLKEDFPQWAIATEKYMDAKLATLKAPQALDPAAIEKMVGERVAGQSAEIKQAIVNDTIDAVFPDMDWQEEVKKPEFDKWIKSDPDWTPEAANLASIKTALADPNSALSKLVKEKPRSNVTLYVSSKVGDVVRLLRKWEQHKDSLSQAKTEPKQDTSTRTKRFAAAVAPRGTGGHAPGRSELDDFEAGYRS
jgi:hypothetical protein